MSTPLRAHPTTTRRGAPSFSRKPEPDPERGIPWAEWKADQLNRLFEEQGVLKQRAKITAATVKHRMGWRPTRKPNV